jgi:putative ABC transport system permease protein
LGFALPLAAATTGLVLALQLTERRRSFAITRALGARPRQVGAFVRAEAALVTVAGLILGAAAGTALAVLLVKVLTGYSIRHPLIWLFPGSIWPRSRSAPSWPPAWPPN